MSDDEEAVASRRRLQQQTTRERESERASAEGSERETYTSVAGRGESVAGDADRRGGGLTSALRADGSN